MSSAVAQNAFRLLGLPADADLQDVYRKQERLQVRVEMGEVPPPTFLFVNSAELSREALLDAVHRVETNRPKEELFWVHELNGKLALAGTPAEQLVPLLEQESKGNTTRSAVARHNLAVIHTFAALHEVGAARTQAWEQALAAWKSTYENSIFWQFMEDRSENDVASQLQDDLRSALRKEVELELWTYHRNGDRGRVSRLSEVCRKHANWLDMAPTFEKLGSEIIQSATAEVGRIVDELNELPDNAEKVTDAQRGKIRLLLTKAESIVIETGTSTERALAALGSAVIDQWSNTRARILRSLSVSYYNVLEDKEQALRLIILAEALARDTDLKQRIHEDWRHVQRMLLIIEGVDLFEAGHEQQADAKFKGALAISGTDKQREEVQTIWETQKRAKVFRGVDRSQCSPGLSTVNGIGGMFYGKRDYDAGTNTYVTTHWFTVLFIPLIPLGAYRVQDAGAGRYSIYGRVPLSRAAKTWGWAMVGLVVLSVLIGSLSNSTSSSSYSGRSSYSQAGSSSNTSYSASSSTGSRSYRGSVSDGEGAAIDRERTLLEAEQQDLQAKKREIESERAELDRLEQYAKSVEASYSSDTIPAYIQQQFDDAIEQHNRLVPTYNQHIREYNAKLEEHRLKVQTFNARVRTYNSSR